MDIVSYQNQLFLNNEGRKIVGGRVFFLDPDSTNKIDVYTYNANDDEYVIAENPVYLNVESRVDHSYFTNQLTLIRVYEYIGDFDDPKQDDDDSNFRFVREYYAGSSTDEKIGGAGIVVHGLNELMNAEPPTEGDMSITVVGYWNANDCEARTYIWDPASNESQDGGYVIRSTKSDSGRWILKYDGEWLPSTYYGVYPGHEENINVLLSYNDTVGTTQEFKTAGGVQFARGNYSGTITLATTKKLLIDAKTHFNRQIQCNSVIVVGTVTAPISDFYFTGYDVEAHSSWFNTIMGFVNCGARYLVIDKNNYFTNTVMSANAVWSDKVITAHGRLPVSSYINGARYRIDNCAINGTKLWNKDDYVYFEHMEFRDDWFDINVANNWDFVNKIYARTIALVSLSLNNFNHVNAYIKAIRANGNTAIDLGGRSYNGSLDLYGFTDVRNVDAKSISLYLNGSTTYDVTLRNVKAAVSFNGRYLKVMDQSDVSFGNQPNAEALWFDDSRVTGEQWTNGSTQIIANNCFWNVSLNYATDNEKSNAHTEFNKCQFGNNNIFNVKRIFMKQCVTDNNSIKIYPTKDNDGYHLFASFIDNTFNSSYPIEFTRFEKLENGYESNCYECIANWTIIGNTFTGNDEGIRCRYWANRFGNYWNKTFIKISAQANNSIVIKGNKGNCPDEDFYGWSVSCPWNENHDYWKKYADTDLYWRPDVSKRLFVVGYSVNHEKLAKNNKETFRAITNNNTSPYEIVSMISTFIVHSDSQEWVDNGDFFKCNVLFLSSPGAHENHSRVVSHIE